MNVKDLKQAFTILTAQFHLSREKTNCSYTILGSTLLQDAHFQPLLELIGNQNQIEKSPIVLGSIFSKYYGSFVTTGVLFALSQLNLAIQASLADVALDMGEQWNPVLRILESDRIEYLAEGEERLTQRERVLQSLFAHHLTPVFKKLVEKMGVKEDLLWANAAFTIHWYYKKWMEEAETEEFKMLIADDFHYLTQEASPSTFGLEIHNPLNIHFDEIKHPLRTDETLRLRKMCCLRYCIPATSNCTTCPNISIEERKRLLLEYEASK